MKWLYAGLALAFGALLAGLASIVLGFRQVIGRYIETTPTEAARPPRP
jgi:hypothetical protein